MTNSERRIALCPQFRTPPGEARADWVIFAEVGRRLGFGAQFCFNHAAEVYGELAHLTAGRPCDQSGVSHARLASGGPLQWPCPATADPPPETARLYTDYHFPTPDGRARFAACHSRGLAEPPDDDFPYVLTTGRLYGHWHTQSRTGRIEKTRKMHPHPLIEVHPGDAAALGVSDGDWLEVRSRRGMARFPARVTPNIRRGTVFVPMHWGALWADQAEANALTHAAACPDSKQPELKACAVQLQAIAPPGSDRSAVLVPAVATP
jgi:ferredoxin-nitrate reductase